MFFAVIQPKAKSIRANDGNDVAASTRRCTESVLIPIHFRLILHLGSLLLEFFSCFRYSNSDAERDITQITQQKKGNTEHVEAH